MRHLFAVIRATVLVWALGAGLLVAPARAEVSAENAQAVQGIVGRGREQERRGRVVERIGGEIWKCRVQGIADDLIDEGGWGVECARPSALVGGHE